MIFRGISLLETTKDSPILKPGVILGMLLLCLATCGCRIGMPKHTIKSGIPSTTNVSVTYNQIRLRMRSLVGPMCGELEAAADRIIAGSTNRVIENAALLWKIEGVPALRAALFQPDPYTAVMDSWVLCNQMTDYFQTGPGKDFMGEASSIAVAACRHMEEQLNEVAASMTFSGDVTKARAFARKWAAEHPILYSISDRETTLSNVLQRDSAASFSTGEAVAEITIAVDDLSRRLEIYTDQLFRQARWEMELFKSQIMADTPVAHIFPLAEQAVRSANQAVETFDRLEPALERAVGLAEAVPKSIAAEREIVVKALQDELKRTITFAQGERVAVLEQMTLERIAALKELRADMIEQRKALTMDIETIGLKLLDHAFWRATQLLAALLVFLSIALAVVLAVFRPSRAVNR